MNVSALLVTALVIPGFLGAQTKPSPTRHGFRLFSQPGTVLMVNRVSCGVANDGQTCFDVTYSSAIGGAFWPKNTANMYVFNSGYQIAGIIGPDGGPWAGDTSGAFFFDPKGTTEHGEGITNIFNAVDANDAAAWPEEARVPTGAEGALFHPSLQGSISASQGDAWWLTWEGDTLQLAGRLHPLGVIMETRAMGWNYPGGNEDILYFVTTFYNITSLNPADYASVRPSLRTILLDYAQRFHDQSNARFGVTLPPGGYTMTSVYSATAADFDVANAGNNYATVNVPFSLSEVYDRSFSTLSGWTFDPSIFSSPFFAGSGIAGIAQLTDASGGGGLNVFSGSSNGSNFFSPPNVFTLYRLLSGNPSPAAGDDPCTFNPLTTKICYVLTSAAADVRHTQSSTVFALAPGEHVSRVTAYVFAAPVAVPGVMACAGSCDIKPGNPSIMAGLSDPAVVANGVNLIDSIAGFAGASDLSGDGQLQADEFVTVPRSLLGKVQVAQAVFDHQFLMPAAPAAPDFFLIPSDGQVTVLWRPSATEQTGDAYYTIARDAQVLNASGVMVPNPLYDPNYRQFDVEGYRIYRSRVDDPAALVLLVQFDYAGTVISDYQGQVNPNRFCAPEVGITTQCGVVYDPVAPGQSRSVHVDVPLAGRISQVQLGDRISLPDGTGLELRIDTMPAPDLSDNGVPLAFVDNTVRNNVRYFYSVTAFDVNSRQSGPSSFESVRVLKSVTPVRPASNHDNTAGATRVEMLGRGTALDSTLPLPAIDPGTGRFSGPFPPATGPTFLGWNLTFSSFLAEALAGSGSFSVTLDSIHLGSPYDNLPHQYWWTATSTSSGSRSSFSVPILQNQEIGYSANAVAFAAVSVDPALASRFGGGSGYVLQGMLTQALGGPDYSTLYGRGCINRRPGFDAGSTCAYNGSRWFDGPSPANNETFPDPNQGNPSNVGSPGPINPVNFTNAGRLTGVASILNTMAYETAIGAEYRPVEGIKAGAHRGADFNVYWGAAGHIDSVIDITHNVVVPFDSVLGGSWGILNQEDAQPFIGTPDGRAELSNTDIGCVEPIRSYVTVISCGSGGYEYFLRQTAVPGAIVIFGQSVATAATAPAAPDPGFILYLAGDWFTFELQGGALPPAGRVWTLRQYVGGISGGNGVAGSFGPYIYSNPENVLPLTAVGIELRLSYDVVNQVNAPTHHDLSAVHTVPDPYYLTNAFESDPNGQVIKFVNLPVDAVIRIYSSSGVLVKLLEHHSSTFGGAEDWDVRNRTGRRVSSGVYFYHVEAGNARRAGRFTVINDRPGF
ncbi:MAG: hypothetical protein ABI679_04570 [Gemmatimonadota bacterium]